MPKLSKQTTIARRKRDFEERKVYILNAAEEIFRVKGYLSSTTDEIAEKAGISVGTIYNLFENKENLFARVIERIAEEIVVFVKNEIVACVDPEQAIEELIRFRFLNYEKNRIFFMLFSSEYTSGIYLEMENNLKQAFSFYYQYLNLVAKTFEQGMEKKLFTRMHPLHLAISFEGIINGFFNYWSRPRQSETVSVQIQNIKDTFLKMAGLKTAAENTDLPEKSRMINHREVYISKFDFERLKELLAVAHGFGKPESMSYLSALEKELALAKIVDPKVVPANIVTMNSRVRIRDSETGKNMILTLVFPADVKNDEEEISILTSLGTALLGSNTGSTLEINADNFQHCYVLEEILYQPESAGDYHL